MFLQFPSRLADIPGAGCPSSFAKGVSDSFCGKFHPPPTALAPRTPAHTPGRAWQPWLYRVCQKRRTRWHLARATSPRCLQHPSPSRVHSPRSVSVPQPVNSVSPRPGGFTPLPLAVFGRLSLWGKSSTTPGISSPLSESTAGKTRLPGCVSEATP